MTVLLHHLWPALAIAALLGVGMAAIFGSGSGLPSARRYVQLGAGGVLAGGLLLMVLQIVPGRPGLWLDIAVACTLAYAVGIAVGTFVRRLVVSRQRTTTPV